MDEKEKLERDLIKAGEKLTGRPVTEQEKAQISEFAESFLLLLEDTED